MHEQINEAVQSCMDIMRNGATLYKKNIAKAESFWQVGLLLLFYYFIIPIFHLKKYLFYLYHFITSISFIKIRTFPVCYLLSQTFIQTARDFELPDVDQKLAQLRVGVSLPLSLLDWINNHGQGMMRKTTETGREEERREKGKEATCVPNTNVEHQ